MSRPVIIGYIVFTNNKLMCESHNIVSSVSECNRPRYKATVL